MAEQTKYQTEIDFSKSPDETQVVLITPAYARLLLATRAGSDAPNRKTSKLKVEALKRQMLAGTFCLSPDAASFDTLGHLSSAKHRLTASAESGVSILLRVIVNQPEEVLVITDQGTGRTASDLLQMRGEKYAHDKASVGRAICIIRGGRLLRGESFLLWKL